VNSLKQTRPELVHHLVPDALWELFRQVVPVAVVRRPQGGGRRRADDRQVLAAIVYVARTGRAWRHIPECFGVSWPTVYRRFADWSQAQVWTRLLQLVAELHHENDELNWARRVIGAVYSRAARDGR
jgi:transposase